MSPKRTEIERFGKPRRRGYVRVIRERVGRKPMVRVLWVEAGERRMESFDDTRKGIAEAKAYGEGVHERLIASAAPATSLEPISIRELFAKYVVANMDHWRPRTLELARHRWGKFELFAGRITPAHKLTRERLDEYKRALIANGHAVRQVATHIATVLAVVRWGVERDLIPATKVTSYRMKFSKDALRQSVQMEEYSADERSRVLAQLSPRERLQWRAWVLTTLFAYSGPRQRAARHIIWADVELEWPWFVEGQVVFAGRIHFRAELDKMGEERWQPMPGPVAEALWVAWGWRLEAGYEGLFVFFSSWSRRRAARSEEPWTFQAYSQALRNAETRAGVKHVKYRGSHGFRRAIAGDIHERTGSSKKAADWIGDKSVKVVERSYLMKRDEQMRELAQVASQGPRPVPEQLPQGHVSNRNETQSHIRNATGEGSVAELGAVHEP